MPWGSTQGTGQVFLLLDSLWLALNSSCLSIAWWAGLCYSQNWAGHLCLPYHRWPSCLQESMVKNTCFLLPVCVGLLIWGIGFVSSYFLTAPSSVEIVRGSCKWQGRKCCSEVLPWQREAWHSKGERGEEGFPHEGHAACGGEGLLLKAESLFPGEDSSEKLPPSKLRVLILPYLCPG